MVKLWFSIMVFAFAVIWTGASWGRSSHPAIVLPSHPKNPGSDICLCEVPPVSFKHPHRYIYRGLSKVNPVKPSKIGAYSSDDLLAGVRASDFRRREFH